MTLRSLLLVLLLFAGVPAFAGPPPICLSDQQCGDGDLCNGIERCDAGTCLPPTAPLSCDDGDACTSDACNPAAGCAHADTLCPASCGPGDDGLRCSDGTACTVGDTCSGGSCVGTPVVCDDADACTVDSCDVTLGCTYVEQADAPACLSSAQCVSAADHTPCVGDGDPCTQDGCLEGACRVGLNQIVRQCADGDACNGDEFCSPVKGCEPGPPPACDDGAICNGVETCVPATGCVSGTPLPDGTVCDDGQTCTEADECTTGSCGGAPLACDDGDIATFDFCLETEGCLHCTSIARRQLNLRFATPTKPGHFTVSGLFAPAAPFAPTAPSGIDFILHEGAVVLQASHVPASAFTTGGGGTVARFVDKTGTIAPGLHRLRVKTGPPFTRHQLAAKGPLLVPLAPAPVRRFTVRAGGVCATAIAACEATAGGKNDRCR